MFTNVFNDLLTKNLNFNIKKIAVIDKDKEFTYEQLDHEVNKLTSWMHARGIKRGDRIGIYLFKSVEEIIAMFAASRLGAVIVNINYQWTVKQFEYVAHDCKISLAIMDEKRANEYEKLVRPDFLQTILVKGKSPEREGYFSWNELESICSSEEYACIDNDLSAILYTSGSTGKPKGVMLTHLNILNGAKSVAKYLKNKKEDRLISVLPFSFDYGLSQLTTMFLVGGSIVLQPVTMPSAIIEAIIKNNVTGFAAVPPTWVSIVRYLLEVPTTIPSLRYITNSGGKIPKKILESFMSVFPDVDIYLMYGLTESFRSTYLEPKYFKEKMGSIGKSIPNVDTYIISSKNTICGPGEEGELVHRGSLVSKGYWGNKEATDQKIKICPSLKHLIGDEKVVYSGDIIKIDEDGFYWFLSRYDSLIKSTGFRISPQEVEEVVLQYDDISEAVAFGKDDEEFGQAVNIVVSIKDGKIFDQNIFMKFCRQNMPHYMVPKEVHCYVGSMPRTASGKIDVPKVIAVYK